MKRNQHQHQPTPQHRLESELSKILLAWMVNAEYARAQDPGCTRPPLVEPWILKVIRRLYGLERRPRNGKIARLPEATRDQINHMLEDGMPYRTIIDKLRDSALPYAISEMNLSNWRRGGHQDWRRKQQDAELIASSSAGQALPSKPNRTKAEQTEPTKG